MDISEILYLLGEEDKASWQGAISPPISQTSNFKFSTVEEMRQAMQNEKDNSLYTRGNNPTVRLLEKKLAALQGTEDALVFSSGSAAIAAAVISQVGAGDHVICVRNAYSWTQKLLVNLLDRFKVTHTFVDGRDVENIKSALESNTRLLILESPNSLLFELQDLEEATRWAHENGLVVMADNSYGSILNRKPAEYGIDLICHSGTKFTGGHSDVVFGILAGRKDLLEKVFQGEYMTLGACMSPFEAWLILRSLRSMPMRLEHSAKTALEVSSYLSVHPSISEIFYPFHESHPQYRLAKQQFDHIIPMFSFTLNTSDQAKIEAFCNSLKAVQIAVSWGGYESLIVPVTALKDSELPANLIRLYVGLEGYNLIVEDIEQALKSSGI